MTRLGEFLCERGLVTAEQLEEAVQQQVLYGGRLGTNLVELNYLSVNELAQALSEHHGVPLPPYAWLESPERAAIRKVSRPLVEKRRFIPLRLEGRLLHVAVLDPHDPPSLDELRFATSCRLKTYVLPELLMQDWLQWLFQVPRTIRHVDTTRTPARAVSAVAIGAGAGRVSSRPVAEAPEPNPRPLQDAAGALQDAAGALGEMHRTLADSAYQHSIRVQPEARVDLGDWRQARRSERPTVPEPPEGQGAGLRMRDNEVTTRVVTHGSRPPRRHATIDQDAETAPHTLAPPRPGPTDLAMHEQAMLDAEDREALIEHALLAITGVAEYGALLVVHQGMVEGLKGCEATKTPSAIDGVLVPLEGDSLFAKVVRSQESERHRTVVRAVDHRLLRRMGRESDTEFGLFPVLMRERVVNLLYADNGSEPLGRASFAALQSLADTIAEAYGHLILRRKGRA